MLRAVNDGPQLKILPYLLSSLSIAVMSEICWVSRSADTRGIRFFPKAEWPAITCVYPPFLMFSTRSGA
jgi:hypothetical protein